jgi:hypothetical protein
METIDPIISSKFLSSSIHSTKGIDQQDISKHPQRSLMAPLESAISLYLKQFNAIWSSSFDIEATCQEGATVDKDNNVDIKSMLKDIGCQDIKISEEGIFIEQKCSNMSPLTNGRRRALALSESFFSFVTLTDQLILQRCRLANHSSTTSTINQPSTTLAHLLYLMIFRHPVFEIALDIKKGKEGSGDANRGDEILQPFYTQFFQYVSAFPDMNPEDQLVRLFTSMRN